MVEGKPYRCGLVAAGLCVMALGLFIMTQEQPHVYASMCALGVTMVCIGTAWSLCQCYPKVILAPDIQDRGREDVMLTAAADRPAAMLLTSCGPDAPMSCSCPALQMV
ncbi:barttin [Pungitius pungitius]|uniref:barttin n=1 Tax=Pungitius pungitius TaxID=134920 RepID=UPI002E0DBA5F